MMCPVCTNIDLVMSERLGIEIDYCPQCRGIWLDRGELDKIIERSTQQMEAAVRTSAPNPGDGHWDRSGYAHGQRNHGDHGDHGDHRGHGDHGYSHHRQKSFWQELFD